MEPATKASLGKDLCMGTDTGFPVKEISILVNLLKT